AVLLGDSLTRAHPGAQAWVDPCNTWTSGCATAAPRGDVVYFHGTSGFAAPLGVLAADYYPRNIVHEIVHLIQLDAVLATGDEPRAGFNAPAFLAEGQAEVGRWYLGMGHADRDAATAAARDAGLALLDAPYRL